VSSQPPETPPPSEGAPEAPQSPEDNEATQRPETRPPDAESLRDSALGPQKTGTEAPPPPPYQKPPAGWYPDPERPGQRYWDGDQWTEHWTPPAPDVGYAQAQAPRGTNGFAIASLVLGILWIYWIGSILALVFGYVAKSQIDGSQGRQGGRGMAIAGIVLGWIGVAILGLVIVLVIIGVSSEPY
jgi:Domain of unknown function (DUF4190)/Protein of unknown function (DUF2510)